MILTELERLDWLDSRGQGPSKQRRVSQPAALLDAWATSLRQQPAEAMRSFFVPSMKVDAQLVRSPLRGHGHGSATRVPGLPPYEGPTAQRRAPIRVCLTSIDRIHYQILPGE